MSHPFFYLRKQILVILCLVTAGNSAFSQNDSIIRKSLGKPEWNRVFNSHFGKLAGANNNSSEIANYASFDVAEGSFKFKGSIPFGKTDSSRVSYLGVSIYGDLMSESYASLFRDKKLNTNTGVQLEYHFRLSKAKYIVNRANLAQLISQQQYLDSSYYRATDKLENEKAAITEKKEMLDYEIRAINAGLSLERKKKDKYRRMVDSLANLGEASFNEMKKHTDTLLMASSAVNKLLADSLTKKLYSDSLQIVLANWKGLFDAAYIKLDTAYTNATKKVYGNFRFDALEFTWLTLIGGVGNKSYYNFTSSLPLSKQINKRNLATFRGGVSVNWFRQDAFTQKLMYANIGFVRERTNNAWLKTTTDVNQELVYKNAAGDTVRKVTKKYTSYTEKIDTVQQWFLFANFYYMFGSRTSGFHVFPSHYIPDGRDTAYTNLGLGYVVSFLNAKTDKPVLNVEGYIQFNDVFDRLKLKDSFWKRNEIGIRFSLPFAFLLK